MQANIFFIEETNTIRIQNPLCLFSAMCLKYILNKHGLHVVDWFCATFSTLSFRKSILWSLRGQGTKLVVTLLKLSVTLKQMHTFLTREGSVKFAQAENSYSIFTQAVHIWRHNILLLTTYHCVQNKCPICTTSVFFKFVYI